MREFNDKVAVVTGAASGMGRAFAERFAREGMRVVLADIEQEALDRAVTEMRQQEYEVLGVVTNTMSRESVEAQAERVTAEYGDVHVLCNNAGVSNNSTAPIWELPDRDWQWVMGVNFWGVLYGIQAFVPRMLAHGGEGHIVNTASIAALVPWGGVYGASKHAVLSVTESLKGDLKARGSRLSASVLCPGLVRTKIYDAERNRPAELEGGTTETFPGVEALFARGMDPAKVADFVLDAIRNDWFYILPHPAWDDAIRDRTEHTLARGPATIMDIADMARRTMEGEGL